MKERIVPHHENLFPLIPKKTQGFVFTEQINRRGRPFDAHNRHHLFFEKALFKEDSVMHRLREHPLSIVVVERDWHMLIHQRFDASPIPDRDTALGFLDEAESIKDWIDKKKVIKDLGSMIKRSDRLEERMIELEVEVSAHEDRLNTLEIIPDDWLQLLVIGAAKKGLDTGTLTR